jgi:hypothetical protein
MSQNGKGDTYRPHDPERFGREYDRIFRRPVKQDSHGSPAESPQPEPAPRPV